MGRGRAARGVIGLGALLLGLGACSSILDTEPWPAHDPDKPGPFGVGHSAFSVTDAARDERTLPVDLWYPVDPGAGDAAEVTRYPLAAGISMPSEHAREDPPPTAQTGLSLLVFSHGYGGINTQSVQLMETLASHGFVVASPEHVGNSQASPDDDFDTAAANRVPDVRFVIDTMLARGRDPADPLHGRLDEASIGVLGHSFGGMTAVGIKAGWAGAEPDPRVAAIAPISAVIDGTLQHDDRPSPNAGFSAEQLARVDVPVMLIGGTADTNVPIENNRLAFEQMTGAPVVYRVDVIGATHTHFANVCDIGDLLIEAGLTMEMWPALGAEDLVEPYTVTCTGDALDIDVATRLEDLFCVAFFRRHLRGERGYGNYLTARFASSEEAAELTRR